MKFIVFMVGFLTATAALSTKNHIAFVAGLNATEFNTFNRVLDLIQNNNPAELKKILKTRNKEIAITKVLSSYRDGLTPLHHLLLKKKPNTEMLKMLLEAGANPNQAVQQFINWEGERTLHLYPGWTALHIAVQCYLSEKVLLHLWNYGGDFLQADTGGWRPADLVFHVKSIPAAKFLVQTAVKKTQLSAIKFKRKRENDEHYKNFLAINFPSQLSYEGSLEYFTLRWLEQAQQP